MKKQIFTVLIVTLAGFSSYAQCDKKISLTASSTEHLNGNNEVQTTDDNATTIEYDAKEIVIRPGDNNMEGTVNSITCDWKTPYTTGKTVIKATLVSPDGQTMNIIITIEGKDGKHILVAEFEEMPDRKIRMTLDRFEEKK